MSEFFTSLEWRQPLWLLLVLQPLLLWFALQWLKGRNQQRFADEALLPWIKVQNQRSILQRLFSRDMAYILAWLGFSLALAGPRFPNQDNPDPNLTTQDVMLVIDLSYSMNATDIKPSRIRRATLEAYEFLSLAKSARVGVIVYAARPHLLVPLTSDFKALEFYLKDLDSLQLPTQGGDSAAAITFAQKELMRSASSTGSDSSKQKNQSIVWLTDGDFETQQLDRIEKAFGQQPIRTYILGLGSSEAAAIPLKDGSWLESNGQAVVTTANFELLEKQAKKGGGVFSAAADDESDWQAIYQQGILKNIKSAAINEMQNWKELYSWFLWPALVLLSIALFPSIKALLVLIVFSLFVALSTSVNAEENYTEKTFDGASAYKSEEYKLAKAEFIQAVLNANTEKQRAMALHNLGNSLFKIGDYENAVYLFSDALRYDPNQKQTLHNQKLTLELYKLLQKRLQRLQMRGPVTAPSSEQNIFDLPEQIAFMLENKIHSMEFNLPEMPKEDMNRLLDKGLAHLQLLESENKKNEKSKLLQQHVNQAKFHLIGLEEQNTESSSALWKRLFEIEEGFPGTLDRPETVPGIRPW